tara:strand:+ start:92 stop:520 length:429 start_codon:yes stop_codon:yes gene_type:complete
MSFDKVSLCDCNNKYCMPAWCCSCCLVSQLAPRKQDQPRPNNKDKTAQPNKAYCLLQGFSFAGVCLVPWVLPFLVRQDLRKRLGGPDDECCKDMLTSVFCCPCSLAQTAKVAEEQAETQALASASAVATPVLVRHQPAQLRY